MFILWHKTGKEGKMPPTFKALATIAAWILFIGGCLGVLGGFAGVIGVPAPAGATPVAFRLAVGMAGLILSVVAIKLRHGLE